MKQEILTDLRSINKGDTIVIEGEECLIIHICRTKNEGYLLIGLACGDGTSSKLAYCRFDTTFTILR